MRLRRRLPARGLAVAVVLVAVVLSVASFVAVDSRSHSASDTLYGWGGCAALIWLLSAISLAIVRLQARRS
jgi:hypothetical protein